ncbi:prepilin peptidase [Geodermatophilus ruber]|uniref:Leader peptidase (Prepilin peptidase) / N-methyltransferase n=1 Tax=Geodermatophilus ruber TaxID=504800 RepID=A0A1I4CHR3_9ACTN|nr:A24 family peptidase [Geodermatophilus ruber]SFK79837.1 leader peptidase (prepilin peptidase) / N-methyltransferase [Geodermatophilus ruber]
MTALAVVVTGVLGLVVGAALNHAAARFPWRTRERSWSGVGDTPSAGGESPPELHDRRAALRPPVLEVGTAVLFAAGTVRFGLSWELPAFLVLAAAGVLLAVIDLRHHLLPNRVVGPALGLGVLLLTLAATGSGEWDALLRAGLGSVALFAVFLVLALISPSGMGMGDVKLAALLGLYLGWLGWGAVLVGAFAGFVVQAFLALALLAVRRIGLREHLPFGPAMLLGAALAIGWSDALLG